MSFYNLLTNFTEKKPQQGNQFARRKNKEFEANKVSRIPLAVKTPLDFRHIEVTDVVSALDYDDIGRGEDKVVFQNVGDVPIYYTFGIYEPNSPNIDSPDINNPNVKNHGGFALYPREMVAIQLPGSTNIVGFRFQCKTDSVGVLAFIDTVI